MQDSEYREFQLKLMPTVAPEAVIGIRVPELRIYAARFGEGVAEEFMRELPHRYYEENNIHAFLIERLKDYEQAVAELDRFLPYVDNWATCDMMRPRTLKKNLVPLAAKIREWLESGHTYTVRYAVGMMMYYLDDIFEPDFLRAAAELKSGEYYIDMMRAWYFAEALLKQYDAAVKYFEHRELDKWTHNKAIQKAVESRRVPNDRKKYLKTLKIGKE